MAWRPSNRRCAEVRADGLALTLKGEEIAQLPLPAENSPQDWADVTATIIHVGRGYSLDLRSADNERIFEAVFDGMLAGLDPFSRYSGAEEARANRANRDGFGGIGIRFTKVDDGMLITHVPEDSPAHDAGLKPGDVIMTIDGDAVAPHAAATVAELLHGPVGSQLTLGVKRLDSRAKGGERRLSIHLARALIVNETVRAVLDDGVLTLRVTGFNKKTASRIHEHLTRRASDLASGAIRGVVMDLRGNPGGLLSQSVSVADLFLADGRIIATRGRHPDSIHEYTATGEDLAQGRPLAVLVDGDSASAAEIVASALQDLGRAVVIGSTSYGKGTVQTLIHLPNDGEVTLTWSRLMSPSGYAIEGLGVMPAVCASASETKTEFAPESRLTADRIDAQRETLVAWRQAGIIFDGRRKTLRTACPPKPLATGPGGDAPAKLARAVFDDPGLYRRALLLSDPVTTAQKH
ncbi:MAG: S41 family peptidase [Alphaproteobacteria bacterium]|nr:S41 family peptidase [Alphaproteobacteria bacterium]